VDTAGCVLQGDVRTKVKTTGTGEIMVEEAVQTSTRRGCANSIISQSRVQAWSPAKSFSKIPPLGQNGLFLFSRNPYNFYSWGSAVTIISCT
jgi:hypothetical protein